MNITCDNEKCGHDFKLDTADFEVVNESPGDKTTQYEITGENSCPKCRNLMAIRIIYNSVNDTGEILDYEVEIN